MGWPPTSEYWGICKDLCFNPGEPGCGGEVVTYNRPGKKSSRPTFRCNRCRKYLSQLRRTQALQLRLFQVDKRDAATLGSLIAKHILLETTVYSNEWAAYQCISRLVDANGTPLNLDWHAVNHSVNFVDPTTGANTQRI
ncbi:hypothetical protein HPB51_003508 [Rhipicephalus microplus]|uniref:ISXO2-like transposase domain-containing protein n=1 Tax=Rhipicephalus microplus TaxID=6941 RepID=A0A9J6EKD9_RHIMP|nr:hypothetical protein HPB51_003508 [Rhipicephalus microplus]